MSTAPDSRTRILDAALQVIRAKGYTATRVEDICAAAGLTKGGFFHHFKGKEDVAVAAAGRWTEISDAAFAQAPYQLLTDPVQRLLGYLDYRRALLTGDLAAFTCLAGTMVQEVFDTYPQIREACRAAIETHADEVEDLVQAAIGATGLGPSWTARSLALHIQGVIQGGFVLAKAQGGPQVAVESLDHLKAYVAFLFDQPPTKDALQ